MLEIKRDQTIFRGDFFGETANVYQILAEEEASEKSEKMLLPLYLKYKRPESDFLNQ